jgi:PAP2 superfamily
MRSEDLRPINRRDFLRLGGAGLAGAVLFGTAGGSVLARRGEAITTASDVVFVWNDVLLEALLRDDQKIKPQREQGGVTRASRAAAIVHAAIHDAVNGVERRITPYLVRDRAPAGASPKAAVAGAAHATLRGLYPSQSATFDNKLAQYLASLPASGRDSGVEFGKVVGRKLLTARQNDGRNSPNQSDPPYQEKLFPGEWRRDPIAPVDDQIPPLTPGWGSILPFTLDYGAQFRPAPNHPLTSGDYRNAFDEVRVEGNANSHVPPNDKTKIANFWSYDDKRGTPIRLYNQHVRKILADHPLATTGSVLHIHARIFALVNLAMADAGIACWDAKYFYNFWRPIHGIRRASEDGNPDTAADQTWKPLGRPNGPVPNTTPPFPAYPSGHSTFGTAMFAMLRKAYKGDNAITFKLTSEDAPGFERTFATFSKAIEENGRSRVLLGVHWAFDDPSVGAPDIGGRLLGQRIADYIWPRFLQWI